MIDMTESMLKEKLDVLAIIKRFGILKELAMFNFKSIAALDVLK